MKKVLNLILIVGFALIILISKVHATECAADGFYDFWYSSKYQEFRAEYQGVGERIYENGAVLYSSKDFKYKGNHSYYISDTLDFSDKYDIKKDAVKLQVIDLKKLDMKFSSKILNNFDLNITKDIKYNTTEYEILLKGKSIGNGGYLQETCENEDCSYITDEIAQSWDLKINYGKSSTTIKGIENCSNEFEYNLRGYSYPGEKFIVFVVTTIGKCYRGDRTETIGFMNLDKPLENKVFMSGDVKWRDIPGKYTSAKSVWDFFEKNSDSDKIDPKLRCDHNVGYDISCIDRWVETCWMLYKSQGGRLLKFDDFQMSQVLFYNNIGYQLYKQKAYENAINYFSFSSNKNLYPLATYNLASVYVKIGDKKNAIDTLKKLLNSRKARWEYITKIKSDKDFDMIRNDAEFKALMSAWKK